MENKILITTRFASFLIAILTAALLTGCQTEWQDPNEGAAVKAAIRAQSVYPDGRPDVPTYVGGRDGITARSSIEAYQRSFALPGGAAGGSSGASATIAPPPAPTPTQ